MSDIFREVDEALQQEKIAKIWKEYGSLIIIGVLALILATAGFSGYKAWKKNNEEQQTSHLITALESANTGDALQAIINDAPEDYANIAVLGAAGSHLKAGEYDKALTVYQDALKNKTIQGDFADLARLMSVRIQMGIEQENVNAAELLSTLEPAMKNAKGTWINHITVEAALIEAHYNQDYAKASSLLETALKNETLPNDLKSRAENMKHIYDLQNANKDTNKEG